MNKRKKILVVLLSVLLISTMVSCNFIKKEVTAVRVIACNINANDDVFVESLNDSLKKAIGKIDGLVNIELIPAVGDSDRTCALCAEFEVFDNINSNFENELINIIGTDTWNRLTDKVLFDIDDYMLQKDKATRFVVWNFRDGMSESEEAEVLSVVNATLTTFIGAIDGLTDASIRLTSGGDREIVFIAEFDDAEDIPPFAVHELHLALIKDSKDFYADKLAINLAR